MANTKKLKNNKILGLPIFSPRKHQMDFQRKGVFDPEFYLSQLMFYQRKED